ncbi:hypothetical protein PQR53_08455 [Paraburkholderia fungorum]|uniref:hypothetical protein n=1 Tax=Paraburkholderia fungorum TaxID=134537 RepID=UPI0038B71A8F
MTALNTTTRRVGNGTHNTERLTGRAIREYRANPEKFPLRFSEIGDELRAQGFRVHDAEVHRATQIECLDTDEKHGIVGDFLADMKTIEIAQRYGVSIVTVNRVVKLAFILEKAERAAAEAKLAAIH